MCEKWTTFTVKVILREQWWTMVKKWKWYWENNGRFPTKWKCLKAKDKAGENSGRRKTWNDKSTKAIHHSPLCWESNICQPLLNLLLLPPLKKFGHGRDYSTYRVSWGTLQGRDTLGPYQASAPFKLGTLKICWVSLKILCSGNFHLVNFCS